VEVAVNLAEGRLVCGLGCEGAVRATGFTEGNVNVESQRIRFCHFMGHGSGFSMKRKIISKSHLHHHKRRLLLGKTARDYSEILVALVVADDGHYGPCLGKTGMVAMSAKRSRQVFHQRKTVF
jgi:hypothetical protein